MYRRQYPKHDGAEQDRGFTVDEIRRGLHLVYIDLECPHCGYIVSLANHRRRESVCPRCGGET